MKELPVKVIKRTPGFMDGLEIRAFRIEPGDSSVNENEQDGITQDEFHSILDRASHPLKPKSDSGKSGT